MRRRARAHIIHREVQLGKQSPGLALGVPLFALPLLGFAVLISSQKEETRHARAAGVLPSPEKTQIHTHGMQPASWRLEAALAVLCCAVHGAYWVFPSHNPKRHAG